MSTDRAYEGMTGCAPLGGGGGGRGEVGGGGGERGLKSLRSSYSQGQIDLSSEYNSKAWASVVLKKTQTKIRRVPIEDMTFTLRLSHSGSPCLRSLPLPLSFYNPSPCLLSSLNSDWAQGCLGQEGWADMRGGCDCFGACHVWDIPEPAESE